MFRAVLELLLMIAAVLVARAVLKAVLGGIARASADSFGGQSTSASSGGRGERQASSRPEASRTGMGELHKDPVCGTYVAESSALRRQSGGQTFYYCSEACREKHSLVTR